MGRRRHRLYSIFASPSISFLSLLFLLSSFAYFSNVNAKANATKGQASVTPINRDLYHTSGALLEEIESLIETFSNKNRGYQAETTIVTYCQGGKDCDDRSKVRILLIVPMENVNGRKLVEKGELCERRNGRGVDLNRNWSVDWGKKEKALFMPYDHKNTTPDGFLSQRMKMMLEKLNHFHLNNRCLVGSGGGSVGYLAHGTATDYMYDIVRVPMAFTFEKVLNEWSAVFFTMFSISAHQIDEFHSNASASSSFEKWVSIDDYLNGYLMERRSRYGKKMEVLELGMQEIRTYFRLFLLSSVLLLFMFCSRISKSSRQIVSAMPF
nr:mast cell carboxypeptidase A [Ipomoea batatas]